MCVNDLINISLCLRSKIFECCEICGPCWRKILQNIWPGLRYVINRLKKWLNKVRGNRDGNNYPPVISTRLLGLTHPFTDITPLRIRNSEISLGRIAIEFNHIKCNDNYLCKHCGQKINLHTARHSKKLMAAELKDNP